MKCFIRSIMLATLAATPLTALSAPQNYAFDKQHSHLQFGIQHLGISTFLGQFQSFDGTVIYDPDDPAKSSVEVTIDIGSIDTDLGALDDHLKSPDFFEVEKYPTATFKSTRVQQIAGDMLRVTGDLTMHGITHPVVLDARMNFAGKHPLADVFPDSYTAYYRGFSATTSILRTDFNMGYATPNLADRVDLRIEAEVRRPLE